MPFPEDRVLVAYLPEPEDFAIARRDHWYRIPVQYAPKGLHAEYIAFYFGRKFGDQKWAVHYYTRRQGHELTTRRALLPSQPEHSRADALYYKVQLGVIQQRERPIISLRWRRITFIHTTWDRFRDAREINDLFIEGNPYVDRLYATLRERGLHPERNYRLEEEGPGYEIPLTVLCRDGRVDVRRGTLPQSEGEVVNMVERIAREVAAQGGEKPPVPSERAEDMWDAST